MNDQNMVVNSLRFSTRLLLRIRDKVIYSLLTLFGPAFSDRKLPARLLLKCVLVQKLLRINHHVSWPVHWTSQVKAPQKITRGDRFPGLAVNCYIDGRNGIKLGKNLRMGPRVSLISMNHDACAYDQYVDEAPIIIGDNCWLGASCIILPGVELGNHVVVAAGAIVTNSFEEDDIVLAGAPARIVKTLASYKETQE